MKSYVIKALWPAFLLACLLEVLVFAFVDPSHLHWLSNDITLSAQTVYSLSFFAFWAVSIVGCSFSILLAQNSETLNSQTI